MTARNEKHTEGEEKREKPETKEKAISIYKEQERKKVENAWSVEKVLAVLLLVEVGRGKRDDVGTRREIRYLDGL